MPIIGIGTDIIETARIEKAATESFLNRYFTAAERELFESRGMSAQVIAAGFAAKEAFVKALGTGFRGVYPSEIEVLRSESGKPFINVYGRAAKETEALGVKAVHVTLSHEKQYALAFVVLEK